MGSIANSAGRAEGIRNMFKVLEQNYGGLQGLVESCGVLHTDVLTKENLQDLFSHRAIGVRVKNFFSKDRCEEFSKVLTSRETKVVNWKVSQPGHSKLEDSTVQSLGGVPYNVALDSGIREEYFQHSAAIMRDLRTRSSVPTPLDFLRVTLDDIWPEGCGVSKDSEGRPYLSGLGRRMRPGGDKKGFIHVDELAVTPDILGSSKPWPWGRADRVLFSANIYLKTPKEGGELAIYPLRVSKRWDFYRNALTLSQLVSQDPSGQRALEIALPEPIIVKPEQGDLILLCAQRPHAARGVIKGDRISVQTFLTLEKGKPLRMDA